MHPKPNLMGGGDCLPDLSPWMTYSTLRLWPSDCWDPNLFLQIRASGWNYLDPLMRKTFSQSVCYSAMLKIVSLNMSRNLASLCWHQSLTVWSRTYTGSQQMSLKFPTVYHPSWTCGWPVVWRICGNIKTSTQWLCFMTSTSHCSVISDRTWF